MSERFSTVNTEIERLPVEDLLGYGSSLVVVARGVGQTPADRYIKHANAGEILPSAESLVAILRSTLLSTPDEIRITKVSCDGPIFLIELEIRRYEGDLAANVPTIALVQVELGRLAPRDYQVVVTETTLYFMDLKHPENAANPTTKSYQLRFKVR